MKIKDLYDLVQIILFEKYDLEPEDLGLEVIKVFDQDAVQGMIAHFGNTLIIQFRGSDQVKDWVRNLKARQLIIPYMSERTDRATPPKDMVHTGFLEAYLVVREMVLEITRLHMNEFKRIIFTGHSLGGAIATLAAVDFVYHNRDQQEKVNCVTFGSPRVGNRVFAQGFYRLVKRRIRVTHGDDPVAWYPRPWLSWRNGGYHHVGLHYRIGKRGFLSRVIPHFDHHYLSNYIHALQELVNQ